MSTQTTTRHLHLSLLLQFLIFFGAFTAFLFSYSFSVQAATFNVANPGYADTGDTTPGDGICANADGDCSLRAAVDEAMELPGADAVIIPDGLHQVTAGHIVISDTTGTTGNNITISGTNGRSQLSLVLDGTNTNRIFKISSPVKVEIKWLTMRNGQTSSSGGAIYNYKGILFLTQVTIYDCAVTGGNATGGAIYNKGDPTNLARLEIHDSTILNNTALGAGGGIRNVLHSTLFIKNSTISGNTGLDGGGISTSGQPDKSGWSATIENSLISNNTSTGTADGGGGISNVDANLKIVGTIVRNNTSSKEGGGLFLSARSPQNIHISNSYFRSNVANSNGGGIKSRENNHLTINSSIFENNRSGEGKNGGGIHNNGFLEITKSVFIENFAGDSGAGLFNTGSSDDSGRLNVMNTTFSGNQAGVAGGGLYNGAGGNTGKNKKCSPRANLLHVTFRENKMTTLTKSQGRDIFNSGCLGIRNSIVATFFTIGTAQQCGGTTRGIDRIISLGHNLEFDNGSCNFTKPGDIQSQQAVLLGPLAGNAGPTFSLGPWNGIGGPTFTHPLLAWSPALGSADSTACLPQDQRGRMRAPYSQCDMGAYENGFIFVNPNQ